MRFYRWFKGAGFRVEGLGWFADNYDLHDFCLLLLLALLLLLVLLLARPLLLLTLLVLGLRLRFRDDHKIP